MVSTFLLVVAQSIGAIEYTDCISAIANECLRYEIKQSDGQTQALEILGMRSTYSLPLLPGPLWPRAVAPDMVLSIGQLGWC